MNATEVRKYLAKKLIAKARLSGKYSSYNIDTAFDQDRNGGGYYFAIRYFPDTAHLEHTLNIFGEGREVTLSPLVFDSLLQLRKDAIYYANSYDEDSGLVRCTEKIQALFD